MIGTYENISSKLCFRYGKLKVSSLHGEETVSEVLSVDYSTVHLYQNRDLMHNYEHAVL